MSDQAHGLGTPDWLLAGYGGPTGPYHFARVGRETYSQSAFLDHRIQPMPTETCSAGAGQVDDVVQQSGPEPAGWILHTAFCASTLLASCLDHPGHCLALKEPLVLSRLASDRREGKGGGSEHAHRVLRLTERSYPGEPVVIKPSNFANGLADVLLGEAHTRPLVLMSSSLQELLISVIKKKDEASQLMPGFLASLLKDSAYGELTGIADIGELDLMQQSFVFWHCQRLYLEKVMQAAPPGTVRTLTMAGFFNAPLDALNMVARHFSLDLPEQALSLAVQQKVMGSHAKNPGLAYSPGQHAQEANGIREANQVSLHKVMLWASPLLKAFPPVVFEGESDPLA